MKVVPVLRSLGWCARLVAGWDPHRLGGLIFVFFEKNQKKKFPWCGGNFFSHLGKRGGGLCFPYFAAQGSYLKCKVEGGGVF